MCPDAVCRIISRVWGDCASIEIAAGFVSRGPFEQPLRMLPQFPPRLPLASENNVLPESNNEHYP